MKPPAANGTASLEPTIQTRVSLSEYTTFRLGGPCRTLINCQTPQQLESIIPKLMERREEFILIGGGSNLVVADAGLNTTVIRYVSPSPLIQYEGNDFLVSGSTLLDDAALSAAEHSLEGLNYASGIPGTVGGAVVGNAGAFGRQVGDYLKSVCVISKLGIKKEVPPPELEFAYRHSNLKESGGIVLAARFALTPGDRAKLRDERAEILKIRQEKHPSMETFPCAGSFFRNIEPTSKPNAVRRPAVFWKSRA